MINKKAIPEDIAEILYNQYYPIVYRKILGLTRDTHLAADITQEAFIVAFQQFYQLRDKKHFLSWVSQIAYNLFRAKFRKHRELIVSDDLATTLSTAPSPEESILQNEQRDTLVQAISRLPQSMYIVVVLYYFEDLRIHEIANNLNIPEGTVKSRLARARKQLQKLLGTDAYR